MFGGLPRDVIRVSSQLQLGLAFATVHTVGFQRQLTVSLIHVANATAAAKTVRLCVYAPGASATTATALLWDFSIPANDFVEFGEGMMLLSQWRIAGLASVAGSVTILISGVEQ